MCVCVRVRACVRASVRACVRGHILGPGPTASWHLKDGLLATKYCPPLTVKVRGSTLAGYVVTPRIRLPNTRRSQRSICSYDRKGALVSDLHHRNVHQLHPGLFVYITLLALLYRYIDLQN